MYKKLNDAKHVTLTSEFDFTDMMMDIDFYKINEGEEKEFFCESKEICVLLLTGDISIKTPVEANFKRDSLFNENPKALHVCKGTKILVSANSNSEILVQKATNDNIFNTVVYEDVKTTELGGAQFNGRATRLIRTIFDYSNAPYSNLVVGEIITLAGNWSSYVPHSHEQPEVYYYRMDHENGFGATFIGDDVYKIEDHSFAAIPKNLVHPQVVAPGYTMYYCWMIRHLENNPWTDRVIDPNHKHLLEED